MVAILHPQLIHVGSNMVYSFQLLAYVLLELETQHVFPSVGISNKWKMLRHDISNNWKSCAYIHMYIYMFPTVGNFRTILFQLLEIVNGHIPTIGKLHITFPTNLIGLAITKRL
jgi:hypothetical protein